jgi:hypothetical protein
MQPFDIHERRSVVSAAGQSKTLAASYRTIATDAQNDRLNELARFGREF